MAKIIHFSNKQILNRAPQCIIADKIRGVRVMLNPASEYGGLLFDMGSGVDVDILLLSQEAAKYALLSVEEIILARRDGRYDVSFEDGSYIRYDAENA